MLAGYGNAGNAEISGLAKESLDAILRKNRFVQNRGSECVRPVGLKSALGSVTGSRKLRDHCGTAIVEYGTEEGTIDAVVLEVFVYADEVLIAVPEIG